MAIDVSPKPEAPEVYIGDGVYASFDGFQIWLWTSNGITRSEKIALDPGTYRNLMEYAKLFWDVKTRT